MKMNKERVIKIVGKRKGYAHTYCELEAANNAVPVCTEVLEKALGKPPRVGMKLALVDLADYDVEGINCD